MELEDKKMEFFEVLKKRQSVRIYKNDPIPEEALIQVLEAFRCAPSWANTQAWEIVLVTDPPTRERLQETVNEGNPARAALVDAPLLICPVGICDRSGWYKGQPSTARGSEWMMFDLGIACEHLALAAAALGLGTVHVGFFDFKKAGEILALPTDRTVVELMPIGYPAVTPRQVPRKPLEEFVFKNTYGKSFR